MKSEALRMVSTPKVKAWGTVRPESQEAPLLHPVEAGWIWAHIKESGFHPKGKLRGESVGLHTSR